MLNYAKIFKKYAKHIQKYAKLFKNTPTFFRTDRPDTGSCLTRELVASTEAQAPPPVGESETGRKKRAKEPTETPQRRTAAGFGIHQGAQGYPALYQSQPHGMGLPVHQL